MDEVFKQTHTLKENKEKFADKRSSDIWDEYIDNTAIATQQAAESGTLLQWIPMRCGVGLYPSLMPRNASMALEVSSRPHSGPLYSPLRIHLPQSLVLSLAARKTRLTCESKFFYLIKISMTWLGSCRNLRSDKRLCMMSLTGGLDYMMRTSRR
ncbi:hypothetical protein PIB30_091633 [Stylosanthes scabra]|uniref:Uncharacterized protein n=1 Tax=Stylosanthes scabra TaxID=79078 RepID=A0ABU6SVC5_9FABA|nr:hypothetical protein [Stylosanthes scabra]